MKQNFPDIVEVIAREVYHQVRRERASHTATLMIDALLNTTMSTIIETCSLRVDAIDKGEMVSIPEKKWNVYNTDISMSYVSTSKQKTRLITACVARVSSMLYEEIIDHTS